jgi:hypothetical protein
MPGDVGGSVGGHVSNDALADLMGHHAGWRGGHAEDAGVAFFAKAGSGGLVGWAIGHSEGGEVGQSQENHVIEQHDGGDVFWILGDRFGEQLSGQ